eukprot:482287-Hanusia_phi.AAC.2
MSQPRDMVAAIMGPTTGANPWTSLFMPRGKNHLPLAGSSPAATQLSLSARYSKKSSHVKGFPPASTPSPPAYSSTGGFCLIKVHECPQRGEGV